MTDTELSRLFEEAEVRLQRAVERAVERGNLGTEENRRQQLAAVQTMLADLYQAVVPAVAAMVGRAYTAGIQIAEAGGNADMGGRFAGVHMNAVEVLVSSIRTRLRSAIETVGRQVEDVFRREGLRAATLNLLENPTLPESTKRLREQLVKEGKTSFVDRAGRRWSLDVYAKMVIRTTSREATTQALLNRMAEQGTDLVEVSSHSHPHDECSPYEGKTFSLWGRTPGYPVLDNYPPFHPNCRHVLKPAQVAWRRTVKAVDEAETLEELEAALA